MCKIFALIGGVFISVLNGNSRNDCSRYSNTILSSEFWVWVLLFQIMIFLFVSVLCRMCLYFRLWLILASDSIFGVNAKERRSSKLKACSAVSLSRILLFDCVSSKKQKKHRRELKVLASAPLLAADEKLKTSTSRERTIFSKIKKKCFGAHTTFLLISTWYTNKRRRVETKDEIAL